MSAPADLWCTDRQGWRPDRMRSPVASAHDLSRRKIASCDVDEWTPPVDSRFLVVLSLCRVVAPEDESLEAGCGRLVRAVGPMQFIPSTWRSYGIDASRDDVADPHNAIDATWAAARYLCALGADDASRVADAIWSYNHSWEYVEDVLAQASAYATASIGIQPASPTLIAMVRANPRLDIYEAGREDIAAGRIDARVLQVLQLASQTYALRISSLQTGHSRCVAGTAGNECRVSHHWNGRAVDVSAVNGIPVRGDNGAAMALAEWLGRLPLELLPTEVGSPWRGLQTPEIHFADSMHADHLHAGWR